jgi:hypothetical protein
MPKCDTSKALVALDGAMALTAGLVAMTIASDTEPAVALLPLSVGAIYLAGAVRGNSNVNKCRKAMGEFEDYTAARDTLPPTQRDEVGDDSEPRRRTEPVVAPPPERIKELPVAPPVAATPPAPVQEKVAPPPVAVKPAAPAPAPAAKAPTATAKAPAAKQAPKQADDEWSDFWREVE